MSFDLVSLGDLLGENGYIRGPFGSALKRPELKEDGIPVYEQQHAIRGNREFRFYIDEEKYKQLKRFAVESNDLIISCSGTVGCISIIDKDDPKGIISQALLILRPNIRKISPHFLYYFFTSKRGFNELINASQGAVQLNIAPRAVVEKIPVPTPSLEVQQKIVNILRSIDNKIELNYKINQTLEAMAQSIFKSWFVDFEPVKAKIAAIEVGEDAEDVTRAAMSAISGKTYEELDQLQAEHPEYYTQLKTTAELFPAAMQNSEFGEIPKGWKVKKVDENLELAYGKPLKEDTRLPGNVPVYGSNGQIGWHNQKLADGPGIVVGRKGNPGTVTWVHTHFYPIDTTFYAISKGPVKSLYYLLYVLKKQKLPLLAADSAVPGLNRNMVYMNKMIVPQRDILDLFDIQLTKIYQKIQVNKEQSKVLVAIRDISLPKLLSGELPVDAAEVVGGDV